jgi:MFS transporter, OFA family, oxalate/formate antiporter
MTTVRDRALYTLGACVIGLVVSVIPVLAIGTSVLLTSIAKTTGWSRGSVSGLMAAEMMGVALGAPIVGIFIDRFGAKRVVEVSAVLFPLSLVALSYAPNFGAALGLGTLAGVVGAGVSQYSYLTALPYFFDKRLGLSLGIAMAGFGCGNAAVSAFIGHLESTCDWRTIFRILAAIVFAVSVPNALFFFRAPGRRDSLKLGTLADSLASGLVQPKIRETILSRTFMQIAACIFLATIALVGVGLHLPALMIDRGMSPEHAAAIFSLYGIALALARLIGGALLDLVDARLVGSVILLGAAASVTLLALGTLGFPLVICILSVAMAAGIDGDLLPYITRRYFGMHSYGTIYGALGLCYALGPPVGSLAAGLSFNQFGRYDELFEIAAAILIASVVLLASLGRPGREKVSTSSHPPMSKEQSAAHNSIVPGRK